MNCPTIMTLLAVLIANAQQEIGGSFHDIEKKLLAQRLAIKSGVFDVTGQNHYAARDEESMKTGNYDNTSFRHRLYLSGDSIRGDSEIDRQNFASEIKRQIRCFSAFDKRFIGSIFRTTSKVGVNIFDSPSFPPDRVLYGVPDPRLLGWALGNFELLRNADVGKWSAQADRKEVKMEHAVLNKRNCVKLTYMLQHGPELIYWLDPEKGFNVVHAESWMVPGDDTKLVRRIDSELAPLDSPTSIWFPRRIHFVENLHNRIWEEDIEINVIQFNTDLGKEWFSLETMNIPPGTFCAIRGKVRGNAKVWDGHSLKPLEPIDEASAVPRTASWKVVLAWNAVICAVVACTLLVKALRRYRAPRPAA